MGQIKVLLADNNYLIREGIKSILSRHKDIEVIGEVDNSKELYAIVEKQHPTVVMIDYCCFGIENLRNLLESTTSSKILGITNELSYNAVEEVMNTGIHGHIFKDCDRNEIVDAVYAMVKGEKFFCGKILETIAKKDEIDSRPVSYSCQAVNISFREAEVIKLIAEGLTNKEIAEKLCLSNHTVTTHRKNIMNKLGINNTAALVLYAIKENIVKAN